MPPAKRARPNGKEVAGVEEKIGSPLPPPAPPTTVPVVAAVVADGANDGASEDGASGDDAGSGTSDNAAIVDGGSGDSAPPLKDMMGGTFTMHDFVAEKDATFYVDKDAFIPKLEKAGKVVALLRPHGWGKSVVLSMLFEYYDCDTADKPFVRVSGGDTALAHSFTMLAIDLGGIAAAADGTASEHDKEVAIRAALDAQVLEDVKTYMYCYDVPATVLTEPTNPKRCLKDLGWWAFERGTPMYVLVDGCDAPVRHAVMHPSARAVGSLARGPLSAFYALFKELVVGGWVARMFLTGTFAVAPRAMQPCPHTATSPHTNVQASHRSASMPWRRHSTSIATCRRRRSSTG